MTLALRAAASSGRMAASIVSRIRALVPSDARGAMVAITLVSGSEDEASM